MPCRDSGLPHDTRIFMGTSGNVFERLLAREGRTSTIVDDSKNLASSSLKLGLDTEGNTKRPEIEMRRERQNSSILVPRFQRGAGVFDNTGGTCSLRGMIDCTRFPISEMHLGKVSRDSMEFQSWKVNCKTEICSKSVDPHLTMHWINEVEIATSIDERLTSRSILERTDFPDCDMLDAMIVCIKKLLNTHVHFQKKTSVE